MSSPTSDIIDFLDKHNEKGPMNRNSDGPITNPPFVKFYLNQNSLLSFQWGTYNFENLNEKEANSAKDIAKKRDLNLIHDKNTDSGFNLGFSGEPKAENAVEVINDFLREIYDLNLGAIEKVTELKGYEAEKKLRELEP